MDSIKHRPRRKRPVRRPNKYTSDLPSSFNIKLFISLSIILITLLMKKYDLKIGNFTVDSIYKAIYYNENFKELSDKVFLFDTQD